MLAFRTAAAADVPLLIEMMIDFNRGEGISWTPERGEPALRRLVGDPSLGVIGLACDSDAVVGYFILTWGYDLEWNGRDSFLTELYLVPSVRRRGLGRELLAGAEKAARANGARALHLMVRHENSPAIALYQGAGYVSPDRYFMSKPFA